MSEQRCRSALVPPLFSACLQIPRLPCFSACLPACLADRLLTCSVHAFVLLRFVADPPPSESFIARAECRGRGVGLRAATAERASRLRVCCESLALIIGTHTEEEMSGAERVRSAGLVRVSFGLRVHCRSEPSGAAKQRWGTVVQRVAAHRENRTSRRRGRGDTTVLCYALSAPPQRLLFEKVTENREKCTKERKCTDGNSATRCTVLGSSDSIPSFLLKTGPAPTPSRF